MDGTVTINTQGIQEWTVPSSGTYQIEAYGAEGGTSINSSYDPGKGAKIKGIVSLAIGQKLNVLVGQQGQNANYTGGGGGGS